MSCDPVIARTLEASNILQSLPFTVVLDAYNQRACFLFRPGSSSVNTYQEGVNEIYTPFLIVWAAAHLWRLRNITYLGKHFFFKRTCRQSLIKEKQLSEVN